MYGAKCKEFKTFCVNEIEFNKLIELQLLRVIVWNIFTRLHHNYLYIQEGEFPWDAHTQEQILAAIYYGFPILQVPAGILADKYPQSCIWLIGVGYLLSAIFTLFVPLAAYAGGAPLIITLRFLSGLSEVGGYSTFFL